MRNRIAVLLATLSAGPLASPPNPLPSNGAGPPPTGTLEAIYVENDGFLLVMDGSKVLVDGLFHLVDRDLPSPEVRAMTEGGTAPFDDLDLILATHADRDHFQARAVVEALRHSPRAVFLGPPKTVEQLRDSLADPGPLDRRIMAIDLPVGGEVERQVAGMRIRIMCTSHGGPHYMYLLERNGLTALHTGDVEDPRTSFASLSLASEEIDLAFFHAGLLSNQDWMRFLEETVGPAHIIPMHISRTQEKDLAPRLEALVRENPKVHYLRRSLDRVTLSRLELQN